LPLGRIVPCWYVYCQEGYFSSDMTVSPRAASDNGRINPETRRHFQNRVAREQQNFHLEIVNGNTLTVEILDGGICLELSDDDDSPIEDVQIDRFNLQQALKETLSRNKTTIIKLDLFASHFRANLTAKMIGSILEIVPPLQQLQLGGLSLSVRELCRLLQQPILADNLTHLALYDLEFANPSSLDSEELEDIFGNIAALALEEFSAVFLRLQSSRVSLDLLLQTLQGAAHLKQFELVLDHNQAFVHGYPNADQQQHPTRQLLSTPSFSRMLQATQKHLSRLTLEYVPLASEHFEVLAKHGKSLHTLRLRDDPSKPAIRESTRVALQHFLQSDICPKSLEQVSFDGILSQSRHTTDLCGVLACNSLIRSVRLRSLPLQLGDLVCLLSKNSTLEQLVLHNIDFQSHDMTDSDVTINPFCLGSDPDSMEETVFATLVDIFKHHNNTLRQLSWKQAEFKRTEVFPRRFKPRTCTLIQTRRRDTSMIKPRPALSELHWYLTLNQRGIRNAMVDINMSRAEFLQKLAEQQTFQKQQQTSLPSSSKNWQTGDGSEERTLDEYAVDCLYFMLSNNPSLCNS